MFWRERTGCVYPVHRSSCVSFIFVVSYKNTSEQYEKPVTCVAINSTWFFIGYVNTTDPSGARRCCARSNVPRLIAGDSHVIQKKHDSYTLQAVLEVQGGSTQKPVLKLGTISKSYSAQKLCYP